MTNITRWLLAAVPVTVLVLGPGLAHAGQTIDEVGVIVCVNDKWDEKQVAKDHKEVVYAGRCVKVPDDATAAKTTEECAGQYEYLPDGSWKGGGTCSSTVKDHGTMSVSWKEGSDLKDWTYEATDGTGSFKGIRGGGTYKYDTLTDTLVGGRYHSKYELP